MQEKAQILKLLSDLKKKAEDKCSVWTDSGDRGMCYHYEVDPIVKMIELMEAYKDE